MKNAFVFVVILAMSLVLGAQAQDRAPELKVKVLTERPIANHDAKIIIFSTTSTTIVAKDSVNLSARKIIHFAPQSVSVDYIFDTATINSSYLEYSNKILEAYSQPGQTAILVDNFNDSEKYWLSFWVEETTKTDTTKFVYQKADKKIETSRKQEKIIVAHLNYWLLGAWIVFFLCIIIDIIFSKKGLVLGVNAPRWLEFVSVVMVIIFVIALIIIIFSASILILVLIVVANGIIGSHKEKIAKTKQVGAS